MEILVGFEEMPSSSENIRYTFSSFIRVNNVAGNSSWFQNEMSKNYIIDNSLSTEMFKKRYKEIYNGDKNWQSIKSISNISSASLIHTTWLAALV